VFLWYLAGLSPDAVTRQVIADMPVELTNRGEIEALTNRLRS
jgi:hypothetical protein